MYPTGVAKSWDVNPAVDMEVALFEVPVNVVVAGHDASAKDMNAAVIIVTEIRYIRYFMMVCMETDIVQAAISGKMLMDDVRCVISAYHSIATIG